MLKTSRYFILLLVAVFSLSMFVSSSAMAEPREKVLICHYDEDYGYWTLIDISGNAVEKHFANHDDGLPGGTTSQTGTALNEYCDPSCGTCLTSGGGPGCTNAECEATVCALDSFCCDVEWDSICVDEAIDSCVGGGICSP